MRSHGDTGPGGDLATFSALEAVVCSECEWCAGCRSALGVCQLGHVPCRCEADA